MATTRHILSFISPFANRPVPKWKFCRASRDSLVLFSHSTEVHFNNSLIYLSYMVIRNFHWYKLIEQYIPIVLILYFYITTMTSISIDWILKCFLSFYINLEKYPRLYLWNNLNKYMYSTYILFITRRYSPYSFAIVKLFWFNRSKILHNGFILLLLFSYKLREILT